MFKRMLAVALLSLLPFSAMALDAKFADIVAAVPHLDDNCSASFVWSDRNKETGDVKNVLLTAKHCVQDVGVRQVYVDVPVYQKNRTVQNKRFYGKVLGTSYKVDLALVQLDDKDTIFKTIKIAPKDADIKMGDKTIAIGWPFSMGLTFTEGNFMSIIKVESFNPGLEYFRATPDIGPGNSGGALIRVLGSGEYELIGVTTAVVPGYPFTGLFTGLDDIHDYLKTALPEAVGLKPVGTVTSYRPYGQ